MKSPWFTGSADVPTFALEELLGTKLRALYQRRKGRDLFDLVLGELVDRGFAFQLKTGQQPPNRLPANRLKAPDHRLEGNLVPQRLEAGWRDCSFRSPNHASNLCAEKFVRSLLR
ncbi:MAG: nucleotidyl transferase AbiEii/AbiGii toxin family protein [Chloroflexota bacterium]